jgi:hypothetical protein
MRKCADGAQRYALCDDADRPWKVLSKTVRQPFACSLPHVILIGWAAVGHRKRSSQSLAVAIV